MRDFLIILFDSRTGVIARDIFRDSNDGLLVQLIIEARLNGKLLHWVNLNLMWTKVVTKVVSSV